MAEVYSNSPCALGKRVLNPHSHTIGQLDFASKKTRLGHQGADHQGTLDRHEADYQNRSPSPVRAGKRARPLSPFQPSSHSTDFGGRGAVNDAFGFSQQAQGNGRDRSIDAELSALRREVGSLRTYAAERDRGLSIGREENARLRESIATSQKDIERLTSENRILKRAVGIQNTRGKEVEGQLLTLQQTAGQAAEYIKRLEQTNYALSVRVQAMGSSGPSDFMSGQRPPDVF